MSWICSRLNRGPRNPRNLDQLVLDKVVLDFFLTYGAGGGKSAGCGFHNNKEGYAELGKRFAEKAVDLVKKVK